MSAMSGTKLLETVTAEMERIEGPDWVDRSSAEKSLAIDMYAASCWPRYKGTIPRKKFTLWFTTIKKMLRYGTENWFLAKRTSDEVFQEAHRRLAAAPKEGDHYHINGETLSWEEALAAVIKQIKAK
jgi:hypothetical protein